MRDKERESKELNQEYLSTWKIRVKVSWDQKFTAICCINETSHSQPSNLPKKKVHINYYYSLFHYNHSCYYVIHADRYLDTSDIII